MARVAKKAAAGTGMAKPVAGVSATSGGMEATTEETPAAVDGAEEKLVVTIADLLQGVELNRVPQEQAVRIVRGALTALGKRIAAAGNGVVNIGALGSFHVRNVEREKDGQKVATRIVVFRAAKPKAKPAGGGQDKA